MLDLLYREDLPIVDFQENWSILHLFYRLKKNPPTEDVIVYDEENVKTHNNSFSRIARWLLYDREEVFK